jgi:hypothetical protein
MDWMLLVSWKAKELIDLFILHHISMYIYLRAAAPAADPGKKKEVRSAAHIRMHVQHAERWCTQHWLPAEFG